MNLSLLYELQAVLDGAEEPVGNREGRGVLGGHVAGVGHLVQAWECCPQPEGRIPAAVDQLQQLHRELHVPDPATAPFELTMVEALFGDDRLRPGLHRPQFGEVVRAEPA